MDQRVNVHFTWKLCFPNSNRIDANLVEQHPDLPVHDHEFMEIVVVVAGTALHHTVFGIQKIGKGDAFLMRPGAWHAYRNCRNLTLYNCCFDTGIMGRELAWMIDNPLMGRLLWSLPLSPAQHGIVLMHLPDSELARARKVLDTLCPLSTADSVRYQADRFGLLGLLLGVLGRQLPNATPMAESAGPPPETKLHPAVIAALKLIDSNPSRSWDVKSLSAHVHANPDYLARTFSAIVGLPPMAYLCRRRLEIAIALLANSEHPVSAVGDLVGWPDSNYFTRRFRAEFGLSPSAYRSRFLKARGTSRNGDPSLDPSAKNLEMKLRNVGYAVLADTQPPQLNKIPLR